MKTFILILVTVMGAVSPARGEALSLAAGQQKILSKSVRGQVTVSNPKSVKVILQKGKLLLVGRAPGEAEISVEAPRRHFHITVYSAKLAEAKNAMEGWLKNTYGLKLEIFPEKLVLHGKFLRLKDWLAAQRLKRRFKNFEISARLMPGVAEQLRERVNGELEDHSLFAAKASMEGDQVKIIANTKDQAEHQALSDMAAQYGIGAPEASHNVELRPMVEIEIVIAELTKEFVRNLGLTPPGTYTATIIPSGDLQSLQTSFNPIKLEFNALQKGKWGHILANPKLLCRSGEEAHFLAGGQIPIKLMAWKSSDVVWKPYGVILDITPVADETGAISTKLMTEVSLLDDGHKVDGIPGLLTNRIETHFDLRGSKTIALSGLIKSELGRETQATPFLGDIPILGDLFKSKDYKKNRTELVVFVTPRVVSPENPPPPPALPAWNDDD